MKLEKGLQSTHYTKKATYKMIRKLHSLEYRRALCDSARIGEEYCVLLYLNHISSVVRQSYADYDIVQELCNQIDSLESSIREQNRVNRSLLVACLKKHTLVFRWLETNHIMGKTSGNETREIWTMKCIPAYICQFKNEI